MPTTAATRPPPAAGPRLRKVRFSIGSLGLASGAGVSVFSATVVAAGAVAGAASFLVSRLGFESLDWANVLKTIASTQNATSENFLNIFIVAPDGKNSGVPFHRMLLVIARAMKGSD